MNLGGCCGCHLMLGSEGDCSVRSTATHSNAAIVCYCVFGQECLTTNKKMSPLATTQQNHAISGC